MSTAVSQPIADPDWGDNRVQPADEPVHNWYRFVLAFPPHLVRSYLDRFDTEPGDTFLDPFCGTGTSLVEAKMHGLSVIGLDVNPVACLAARVKTSCDQIDPSLFLETLEAVLRHADERCTELGLADRDLPLFDKTDSSHVSTDLPGLSEEQQRLLLRDSISPLPLAKLLVLRGAIQGASAPSRIKDALLLSLARCAVTDASNLGFGPEVHVQKARKTDVPVLSLYEHQVRRMVADIERIVGTTSHRTANRPSDPTAAIVLGDSREMPDELRGREIHAVVTSPPYPNEKDYTRAVRLELVLLGYLNDRKDLRALKKTFLRSNSRGVYAGDEDDKYLNGNERVEALAKEIEARRQELGKTSGFERMYHRVVRQFFGGMARHLRSLKSHLSPGAQLAYVVGDQASFFLIHIHTAEILAEIAEDEGYGVVGIDLWRERRATASGELLREDVLVLRLPS